MRTEKFSLLTRALEQVVEGQPSEARRSLAELTKRLDVESVAEDMQYVLFAAALARRLGDGDAQQLNLYLKRFELPQISLFNLLAQRLPLASLAGSIANDCLCDLFAGHEEATLIDVGLGTGRQEVALLRRLKERGVALRRLTVVGVEPDTDSLHRAETDLTAAARELDLDLRFRGIPRVIEALGADDWRWLRDGPGPRVVHSAFALHHMAGDLDQRQVLFERFRELEPTAVVLIEPNSDHFTNSLAQRFHNAWRHLFFIFGLVDELQLPVQERNAIKRFFGRELEDILGAVDDSRRFERHERKETWLERLRRAGFSTARRLEGSWSSPHPAMVVHPEPGHVGLCYREETVVAVIRATVEG
ncbi:GRAS family protein [Archangium sp.]|uniref:GRAS family protein n=1 Tax=Archangium sp. TaxID=1872627 RepID=UPI002EDAFAA7